MSIMKALRRFGLPLPELNVYNVKFPTPHEAKWLTDDVSRSPDLGYLEQFEFQLLFSPDETRIGYSQYDLVKESVYLGVGYTQNTYAYWMQDVEGARQAIPIRQDGKPMVRWFPPSLKIKGDIHAIQPYQFKNLDDWKRNRSVFRRQRVNILLPYRTVEWRKDHDTNGNPLPPALQGKNGVHSPERVHILRCWMYVGIPEYWDQLLDAGFRGFKPVNHYQSRRPWLQEYYDFPKIKLE